MQLLGEDCDGTFWILLSLPANTSKFKIYDQGCENSLAEISELKITSNSCFCTSVDFHFRESHIPSS